MGNERIDRLEARVEDAEDQLVALRRLPQRVRDLHSEVIDVRETVEVEVMRRLNALSQTGNDGTIGEAPRSIDFKTWLGVVSAIVLPLVAVIIGTR